MLPQTPEDVSTILAAAKNFGGWGVSLIMAFYGGRAFMALAREFKTEMVFELKAIRDALLKNEAKLETLVHEFNSLRDTDDGLPIIASIRLPATLRESTLKKHLGMVYLSMTGEGNAQFTVFGKTQDWAYPFPLRDSGQTRCPVGRGIRENYLGFGLSNPHGQHFALDRVEVLTAQSKTRRV